MPAPVQIPLSQSGDPVAFRSVLEAHRADLDAHRSGPPGVPAPRAHPFIEALIERVPRGDPLPDAFELLAYEIIDDTPRPPEQEQALQVLRETLGVT